MLQVGVWDGNQCLNSTGDTDIIAVEPASHLSIYFASAGIKDQVCKMTIRVERGKFCTQSSEVFQGDCNKAGCTSKFLQRSAPSEFCPHGVHCGKF